MRTTLDIANDVLQAEERARREKKTAGEVISELERSALTEGALRIPAIPEAAGSMRASLIRRESTDRANSPIFTYSRSPFGIAGNS